MAAWDKLREKYGDEGRDALAVLLRHERQDVRVMAACLLLRHRTNESVDILEQEAKTGHIGAILTLRRWREGSWQLDP